MTAEHPSLAAALAAFQADLPTVGKDSTAQVKSDKGSYSYRYADLAAVSSVVLPLLGRHGMSFSTRPTLADDGRGFHLHYALRHTSGEVTEGVYPLPPTGSPQQIGSAITYARRYTLLAVTGVAPDDDDDDARRGGETVHAMVTPVQQWDPVDQEALFDAWSTEIENATTKDEIGRIGKALLANKKKGEMSPTTYAKLAALGGKRAGVIDSDNLSEMTGAVRKGTAG